MTWTTYEKRLDSYFTANEVGNNKKIPALLSPVVSKKYTLLRDLNTLDLPKSKSSQEPTKTLKDYHSPKPLVIVERFRYHKRDQEEGENVREYIAALRKLSKFGDVLNDKLRDRFVCELRYEQTRKKNVLREKPHIPKIT
jgi:hypothetical protein